LAESGRPASAVARELQISDNLLRRWRREFAAAARSGASVRDAFPGNGKLTSQDEEIRQLRRRVAQLEEEREILKKATAFFARESR
jgi:transposase